MKILGISAALLICSSALIAAEFPELAPLAAAFKSQSDALDSRMGATFTRISKTYEAALVFAERSATTTGDLQAVAAITSELTQLRAAKSGGLDAKPPVKLPAQLLQPRKTYLDEYAKAQAELSPQKQKVAADYLRALAALQAKAAGNPALLEEIAARKARLLAGAEESTVLSDKFFEHTEWIWLGRESEPWKFLPDGKIIPDSQSKSKPGWRITGPDTFMLTANGKDWIPYKVSFTKMVADPISANHSTKQLVFKRRSKK